MRRHPVARITRTLAVLVALCPPAAPLAAHPLHNSFTEVTYDTRSGRITASMRVFTDDFTRHIRGPAGATGSGATASDEQRAAAYVFRSFALQQGSTLVPLRWCGWKHEGEMTALCLTATLGSGLHGIQMRNTVLMDLFGDQINIVKGEYGGSKHFLLFTIRDRVKALL
jgi:hypothetical protein